ncbi:MAG TPA: DUF397 domain-containing protein [Actinophytocola sp.]|nr:DUF397 domain-containing protein [Actinophytocola sp.]HEV2779448.1 DUF397 domain-containing protein [Actinophytocola sp.]
MSTVDLRALGWRTSSRSSASGSNANCVEIAFAGSVVAVRDSKNPAAGTLTFPAAAFTALVRH